MLLIANRLPIAIQEVLKLIAHLPLTNHAGKAHYEIVSKLDSIGFFCECEHPIYFSDGTQERIDIMAHRDGMILAIEVDARFKSKSIERLKRCKGGDVFVINVVLKGNMTKLPEGIDAIVIPCGEEEIL